jgi:outer membrane lipoprotein-sorting protein
MTTSWPSRSLTQVTDIGTAQGRVQKYFVNGTAAELRGQFDIHDHGTARDRPDLYHVTMVPKRKQIREALVQLDLWVNRSSLLLDTIKMTFANGDTKTMAFEDVVPNATIESGAFRLDH